MDISLLWTTDPGLVALGLMTIGLIAFFVTLIKSRNIFVMAIPLVIIALGVICAGAVMGHYDLPFTDYFNLVTALPPANP